jgi:hypothetical protein
MSAAPTAAEVQTRSQETTQNVGDTSRQANTDSAQASSVSAEEPAPEEPKPQTISNKYGTITASSVGPSAWQFAVSGRFSMQQDSYSIDFGDGSRANLTCESFSTSEPVCYTFAAASHTFTQNGPHTVSVVDDTRGLGNNELYELLSIRISQ